MDAAAELLYCSRSAWYKIACCYTAILDASFPPQIWPYLLGHYKWHYRLKQLEEVDRKNQESYENKLSDWMAIEAIVRQKDKETTAANIAKLSGAGGEQTYL